MTDYNYFTAINAIANAMLIVEQMGNSIIWNVTQKYRPC